MPFLDRSSYRDSPRRLANQISSSLRALCSDIIFPTIPPALASLLWERSNITKDSFFAMAVLIVWRWSSVKLQCLSESSFKFWVTSMHYFSIIICFVVSGTLSKISDLKTCPLMTAFPNSFRTSLNLVVL